MNFLKWYTPIVISFAILAALPSMIAGESDSLMGIALFIPAAIYAWILAIKRR